MSHDQKGDIEISVLKCGVFQYVSTLFPNIKSNNSRYFVGQMSNIWAGMKIEQQVFIKYDKRFTQFWRHFH